MICTCEIKKKITFHRMKELIFCHRTFLSHQICGPIDFGAKKNRSNTLTIMVQFIITIKPVFSSPFTSKLRLIIRSLRNIFRNSPQMLPRKFEKALFKKKKKHIVVTNKQNTLRTYAISLFKLHSDLFVYCI